MYANPKPEEQKVFEEKISSYSKNDLENYLITKTMENLISISWNYSGGPANIKKYSGCIDTLVVVEKMSIPLAHILGKTLEKLDAEPKYIYLKSTDKWAETYNHTKSVLTQHNGSCILLTPRNSNMPYSYDAIKNDPRIHIIKSCEYNLRRAYNTKGETIKTNAISSIPKIYWQHGSLTANGRTISATSDTTAYKEYIEQLSSKCAKIYAEFDEQIKKR